MNTDVVLSTVEFLQHQHLLQELRKTSTREEAIVTLLVADSLQCELDSDFSDNKETKFSTLLDNLVSDEVFHKQRPEVDEMCNKAVELVEQNLDESQFCRAILCSARTYVSKL